MFRRDLKTLGISGKAQEYECGLPGCWNTGAGDVFYSACFLHDVNYLELKPWESTYRIDQLFLRDCLAIAGEDKFLRTRAHIYYRMARTYGMARYAWKSCFCWPWGRP